MKKLNCYKLCSQMKWNSFIVVLCPDICSNEYETVYDL